LLSLRKRKVLDLSTSARNSSSIVRRQRSSVLEEHHSEGDVSRRLAVRRPARRCSRKVGY